MTYLSSEAKDAPVKTPSGITINEQGAAQVAAERKRLGITEEVLERSRNASLERPF